MAQQDGFLLEERLGVAHQINPARLRAIVGNKFRMLGLCGQFQR
jgi:hypothetical protein